MNPTTTLVYQAYGRTDIIRQTLFSVISLLNLGRVPSDIKILIYTDRFDDLKNFFQGLETVEVIEVKPAQIQKWRGAIDFVHRVKLEVLKDAGSRHLGSMIYLDGDTYFQEAPWSLFSKITPEVSLMHIHESHLEKAKDPLTKKIHRFFKKNKLQIQGKEVTVPGSASMWNAGVIGIAHEKKPLFDHMIEFTDQAYSKYQKHVMEQLAVSFHLETTGDIHPAHPLIQHYWDRKEDFQEAIDQFLGEFSTAERALSHFGKFKWPEDAPQKPKSLLQRLFSR